ncbi:hypothetical protein, partial [Nodosilinea sp. LEGE 07088]|uniref:hypothetical protein n=1 Tax=Nodosilinea sp. LEGE 07088 TaxID=2777968 RepID=UPI001882ACBC
MPVDPRSPDAAAVAPVADVWEFLVGGLSAYGRLYGLPDDSDQVQGILGTLLRLHQPEKLPAVVDHVVQQVLDGLTPEALKNVMVNRASSTLAKATRRWQQQLESQVEDILATYLQRYSPTLTPDTLRSAATAVMPLLGNDRPPTRAETVGLISYLVRTFDPEKALTRAINPIYLAIAHKLAISLSQKPLEAAVSETVTAYVAQYAPTLTSIGADLIATALGAVLKNQVDFNFDTQLSVVDEKLLIEQVSFQLNILRQSPLSSKAAEVVAAEVNAAVEAFLSHRRDRDEAVDVTTGLVSDDGLSVSSPWTSTRPPAAP